MPADINILAAVQVPHRFHARHDAVARRYLYQIARRRTAFAKAYVWWVRRSSMSPRCAAARTRFVGMRDFRSFAAIDERDEAGEPARSTLVLVDRLDLVEDGDLLLVGVEGSHFLWKMVRRMVGVLVEIGRGGLKPADAARFLAESSDAPARLTAPPSGLFLDRVFYRNDARDVALRAATPLT